jgi:integrase
VAQSSKANRRRSAGEGSIYRAEDGRWRGSVAFTLGDGTRQRRYVSGASASEARGKLDAIREQLRLGTRPTAGPRTTIAGYLEEWIASDSGRVRWSTWRTRQSHIRLHLIPHLGRAALSALSAVDVERALARAVAGGLSPRSASHVRATLRRALADAVRDGLVARNAAADARPPRIPHRAIEYLEPAELRRLIDASRDDQYGPVFALAATSGLRLGELLGLAWKDIDEKRGTLTVRQALAEREGGWALTEPKSAKSRRTIPVPTIGRDALERQRRRQADQRASAGTAWQDRADLVFTDPVGRPLRPDAVTKRLHVALDAAGLRSIRFHDLRHSAATMMLAGGVPLAVVSDWLGHSGVAITLSHYAHVVPQLHEQAAAAVDEALR